MWKNPIRQRFNVKVWSTLIYTQKDKNNKYPKNKSKTLRRNLPMYLRNRL